MEQLTDEVRRRVGTRYQPAGDSHCLRWGQQPGYVVFNGQKVRGAASGTRRAVWRKEWKLLPSAVMEKPLS